MTTSEHKQSFGSVAKDYKEALKGKDIVTEKRELVVVYGKK